MDNADSAGSAFYLLHASIQQKLYDMRWTELRPIQAAAIRAFFQGTEDLIVAADTASGKTEAAFLPILSRILQMPGQGLRVLYVSPLRALINDQFGRLEDLCRRTGIPVFKWHGDVASPRKKKFLAAPGGVLLITPESIESIFVNHSQHVAPLFKNLSWIVLDELHAFMGTERGAQLKSLLSRIEQARPRGTHSARILALSATIGDLEIAKAWLRPHAPRDVKVLTAPDEKEILYRLKAYQGRGPWTQEEEQGREPWTQEEKQAREPWTQEERQEHGPWTQEERQEGDESGLGGEALPSRSDYVSDLIRLFPSTALVFVNSKRMLEHLAYTVQRVVEAKKLPDRYRVHHGSLSKDEREDTEEALKTQEGVVTFCSSTLELGIDVGNVERVGQFGAPWSVSALRQRLGRSGRKDGEPSALVLFIVDKTAGESEHTSVIDKIHLELLQTVAMSELLFERWCEPPALGLPHYSTLAQQCLSVIAEKGGVSAKRLYDILVGQGAFVAASHSAFTDILRSLGTHDLVEQTPEGALILGLAGERLVRRRDFYAAFAAPQEISVVHRGRKVGSIFLALDMIPEGLILLAGRRWKIMLIDLEKNEMTVEPAKGGKAPPFGGDSGPEIHSRVRRKMFEVLAGNDVPRYLDSGAANMLREARSAAREAGLLDSPFLRQKRDLLWLPWESSAVHRTLTALGLLAELEVEDRGIALEFKRTTPGELREAYAPFLENLPTVERIAAKFELALKGREKYDCYLPENLLLESFGKKYLDIQGALKVMKVMNKFYFIN
ncbi:MAG: DEAD/DEAH box helicase [Synergistaceae bacterium]|jgi:ATP-dependent Lhr-like helicase|nr:DEAD/DEAH box helicase [Synergistaceae bacterium]